MKKHMIAFFLCCMVLGGCGNSGVSQEEYDRVVAERDSLEKELNTKESEQNAESEPNVIYNEKYSVDGEEISIILGETNKEISLTMYGHAKDREKAYLMFATFLAECKNIEKLIERYSVVVNMGALNITYMTTDGGYAVMGKNEDGTTVLKKPDWIPEELSELTMAESEIESYILELDSKILEFGEKSGYRMGVLIDETKTNSDNGLTENSSEQKDNSVKSEANNEIKAQVVEEYHYINSIGSAQYFLIVKNNSSETISVNINATAKDADGNLIGATTQSEEAIPSGYEVCIGCHFSDAKNAASFEYTLDAKKDKYYEAVIQDLMYEESRTDKKVIISCTNNGKDAAEFVKATALFFLNGELIRSDSTYMTDDDSEIKPGATIIKEMNSFGEYDDVKIYFSGRK